ncbi:MAG: type II toxin-antitoxin system VapC family toxin [Acaryochloridaceae cyanobacterium RL_2_7]|nr:type II toxin-antitoxin system VapC family toxin [Acaryochloridaceae cyanobacterium RL_2_7]
MILLDTHIWIWWVSESPQLTSRQRELIETQQSKEIGVSIFSCWEIAKLVEKNRLQLSLPVEEWLGLALAYPGVVLLDLTLPIVLQSTRLKDFHNDPANQIIVATALVHQCPLLTMDGKIRSYPLVEILE